MQATLGKGTQTFVLEELRVYICFTFSIKIQGPNFNYNSDFGNGPEDSKLGNGPEAFKCRCIQTPPNCQPDDGYDPVLVCDNTGGVVDTSCSYSHTVGTAYSNSMTEEMSISVGLKETITSSYFENYRLNIFGSDRSSRSHFVCLSVRDKFV